MDKLQVESSLFMTDGVTFKSDVNLVSASVGSQLAMSDSTFKGVVNMFSLKTGQHLILRARGLNADKTRGYFFDL